MATQKVAESESQKARYSLPKSISEDEFKFNCFVNQLCQLLGERVLDPSDHLTVESFEPVHGKIRPRFTLHISETAREILEYQSNLRQFSHRIRSTMFMLFGLFHHRNSLHSPKGPPSWPNPQSQRSSLRRLPM